MSEYLIKLSSGGRSLEISPESVCRLLEGGLIGFDAAGFDVKVSSYAMLTGGSVNRRRFAERELGLLFEIAEKGERADAIRREIVSMLDPRLDTELEVTLFGVSRKISVIPCGEARFVRPTVDDCIEVELRFIAPEVFFSDTRSTVIKFRDAAPLLTFPMNFMAGAGTAAGLYRTADSTLARNRGDGECGIVARIRASGGEVVNPTVRCGEKFVKCNTVLADGDLLVIDTRARMKNIYLNGERFFLFDRDSEFFSLPAGDSDFSVTADSGGEFIVAEVEFTPVYYGV